MRCQMSLNQPRIFDLSKEAVLKSITFNYDCQTLTLPCLPKILLPINLDIYYKADILRDFQKFTQFTKLLTMVQSCRAPRSISFQWKDLKMLLNICLKFSCYIFRFTGWSCPSEGVQNSDWFVGSVTHFTVWMKEIPVFWHETVSCEHYYDIMICILGVGLI